MAEPEECPTCRRVRNWAVFIAVLLAIGASILWL